MGLIRGFVQGFEAFCRKKARNGEIEEELRAYLEDSIEDKMRHGMGREDAMRVARAEIGSVTAVRHKVWSAGWESQAEMLWHDLIYTLRRLARTPGAALVVVLSVGLGIAANATIFSLVSKFVLAPAPVGDPKTLTTVYRTYDNGAVTFAIRRSRSPVWRPMLSWFQHPSQETASRRGCGGRRPRLTTLM
jgi:hypothetical protein